MRRTAAWKPIAGVAAATIAIAGFGAAPATAAPGDSAEALAEVLGAELLDGQDLLGAATALTGFPSNPDPQFAGLDVSLLGGDISLVTGGLALPLLHEGENNGLLELGSAGALTSFVHTDGPADAVASSGVLDENGAIAFDANEEPPAGTTTASVDATALLDQLGLGPATGGIVNELALELGAVASHAEEVNDVFTSDYRVADLTLELDSPAVGQLVSALNGSLDAAESNLTTGLGTALGDSGILNQVLGALGNVNVLGLASVDLSDAQVSVGVPDLNAVVNTALSGDPDSDEIIISSGDGAIDINLTAGTVSLDVAQLVDSIDREDPDAIGLNGFPANTELLQPQVLTAITNGVTSALGNIVGPVTAALDNVLDTTTIGITIPVDIDLLPLVLGGVPVADGSVNINGSLAQIIAGDPSTISAPLTLLPIAGTAGIQLTPLTNAVIAGVAQPILSGVGSTLDGLLDTADGAVSTALTTLGTAVGTVITGLSPVLDGLGEVVQITVNVQPPAPPAPGVITPMVGTESGDLAGGNTVRALTLTLLPNLAGSSLANLDFASSSVSNVEPTAAAGTLVLDPDRAHDGDTIAISGDGWTNAGDVTVIFTDADGVQVGETVTTTPVDGVITDEYLIPDGTDPQTLTATATQDGFETTAELEVFGDPTVVVDPDPVDPGDTITISGSGFVCGPVTVTVTGGPAPVTIPDVPVAEDGTWSTTYLVPADTDANTLMISAVATGDCDDTAETPVEVDQPESLELTPGQVRVGDDVAIDGDGWATGSDVVVTFTDSDGIEVGTESVTPTGAAGTIDGAFTVPEGTAEGTLTGSAVQGDDTSTDTVTVFGEPIVIVDPDPVDPGETITITGSGFLCGPVTVTITGGPTPVTLDPVPVASDGSWSTTYEVPEGIDAASLTINATSPDECGEAEVPVDIDQPETLELAPGEVRGGDEITIDGTGWEGDGPVTVIFTDVDGDPIGEPVVTTPVDGVITDTFEVPEGTPAGPITGTATRDGDEPTTDTVQVFGDGTVSVEPGSVRAGATVDVTGGGWLPNGGDVTVTFTDGDTTIGDPVVIDEISATGTIEDTFTVPPGTDPATLTVTAVQGDETALDTLAVVADPSITLDPTTARPGDTVDVDGEGWADGTVTVIFTDGDVQVGETLTLPVTGGVISGTYTVPADAEPGTLTATATQGEDEATAELEITLAPTVSASPSQVHGGDSVTIGGSGWGTDVVTVTITDVDGDPIGEPLELTPVDGVIDGDYLIPEGTEPGDYDVEATDGADTATDTVAIVADPTVTVEPDPADPGQQVIISGSGFLCGPVTVTIADGTPPTVITDIPVIGNAWSTTYTVPLGVTVDSLTITAVAQGECGDEGETELEVDLVETLTASPAFAEVGDVVTVAGTGWADGIVSLTATDVDGTNVGLFTATAADGAFSTTYTVPPNADLGALEFEATQGDSVETATITVVSIPAGPATLIVSPSAVEPGTSVALDGEGWDPTAGPVTVTFTTAAGVAIGAPVAVLVSPDGGLIRGSFTVPENLDAPQVLIATGAQGDREATDTLEVREADLPVIRLGGPTRIEVAVEISRDAYPFGTRTVFIASAATFPDALSAAPAAAQVDAPILLTWQDNVPAVVQQELDRIEPDRIIVVGGPNTIAPSTYQTLAGYAPSIERIGGADRFEVSQNIAEWAFPNADTAYIASGLTFPDALTAGAAAGAAGAPMILTHGSQPWPGVLDTLEEIGVQDVFVAGGPVTIPQSNITAIENAGFDVVQRFGGATRYDVGVNVAEQFDGPTDRIYVATGVRFPDALAGSAIAGAQGHPVFVSPVTCLWQDIPGEIARLGGPQVVLLGGTASLNEDVFDLQTC